MLGKAFQKTLVKSFNHNFIITPRLVLKYFNTTKSNRFAVQMRQFCQFHNRVGSHSNLGFSKFQEPLHTARTPSKTTHSNGLHTSKVLSSDQDSKLALSKSQEQLLSQMHMRMINENSFLSWCRNAYLSTVVGVAMLTGGSTALAQGAGAGAFVVGGMNLFWGTGCHVTNLIRLRHVTGMSGFTLFLNLIGSTLHSFLWLFVVICYIGFLDETNSFDKLPGTVPEEMKTDSNK